MNTHFNQQGSGSKKSAVRLHRTKCTSIIVNVIKPAFVQQLKEEIGQAYYSIILDESTDIGQKKLMACCIGYYNSKMKKVVTDFLGLQVRGCFNK